MHVFYFLSRVFQSVLKCKSWLKDLTRLKILFSKVTYIKCFNYQHLIKRSEWYFLVLRVNTRTKRLKFQWNGNFDFKLYLHPWIQLLPKKACFILLCAISIFYAIQWYIWWHLQQKTRKSKLSIISGDSTLWKFEITRPVKCLWYKKNRFYSIFW